MQVTVSTEVWNTREGQVVKAVTRNTDGSFNGATNQTAAIKVAKVIRPRVKLVGRK